METPDISAAFWATITGAEFAQIMERQHGCLDAEQCERLWRFENWPGKPPQSLELRIRREDAMRIFPPLGAVNSEPKTET